jgi:hypothetical protein
LCRGNAPVLTLFPHSGQSRGNVHNFDPANGGMKIRLCRGNAPVLTLFPHSGQSRGNVHNFDPANGGMKIHCRGSSLVPVPGLRATTGGLPLQCIMIPRSFLLSSGLRATTGGLPLQCIAILQRSRLSLAAVTAENAHHFVAVGRG